MPAQVYLDKKQPMRTTKLTNDDLTSELGTAPSSEVSLIQLSWIRGRWMGSRPGEWLTRFDPPPFHSE